MTEYAALITGTVGMEEEAIDTLLYSSSMHDIGKIGVSDNILFKPGKLDPDEWKIMRQHTEFGASILEDSESEFINVGKTIALTHHEKWDGTGYPNGLRAEAIPLEGRIAALADVFDALTTKRPYKEAFSNEKAFRIIREEKGGHFDPEVVDAFFDVLDEILKIRRSYTEKA